MGGPPAPSGPADDVSLLRVGELAQAVGKTVRAIHHYEKLGLVQPHTRSKGRYRLYAPEAVTRVRWIGKLHDLGMTLTEIQEVVSSWEGAANAPEAMTTIRAVYKEKLREVRSQIEHLETLERELAHSLDYLNTCESTCDVDQLVHACSECTVHDPSAVEPDLVSGIYAAATHHATTTP